MNRTFVEVDGKRAAGNEEEVEEPEPVLVQPELYVTTRQFRANKSLIGRLPRSAKDALSTGGVCHFMAVYRSEKDELWQLDFGPFGGDVHSRLLSDANNDDKNDDNNNNNKSSEGAVEGAGGSSRQRRSELSSSSSSSSRSKSSKNSNSTPGHIRVKLLDELPTDECEVFYVGTTSMTLEEVRAFNATRDTIYTINKNDCRHYVNELCRVGAGVERACSKYVQGAVWGRDMLSSAGAEAVGDDGAATAPAAAAANYADEDGSAEAASSASTATATASVEQRRRRHKRELAVLLPISLVTDLENAPLWDRLGQASAAALVIGIAVRAVPPALVAMAASRAAAGAGASMSIARQRAAGMGAAVAGVGAAAEAGGLLVRAAAVTQPLVAPTVRRLITTAAGVAGGAREDIAENVRRGRERAARALASLGAGGGRGQYNSRIGRAAALPTVGWAGRKLTAAAAAAGAGAGAGARAGRGR